MLRDDVATLIANRCGKRADLLDTIKSEMSYVQTTILEGHEWLPWFLETDLASAQTIAGEERLPVPSDFLREIDEECLWLYDGSESNPWVELSKLDYDTALRNFPGSGRPKVYALVGDYFMLRAAPDDVYQMKLRYYARDAALDSNIENKWLRHALDVMTAEVGHLVADKHIQNPGLAQRFDADRSRAWDRLYRVHTARDAANRTWTKDMED